MRHVHPTGGACRLSLRVLLGRKLRINFANEEGEGKWACISAGSFGHGPTSVGRTKTRRLFVKSLALAFAAALTLISSQSDAQSLKAVGAKLAFTSAAQSFGSPSNVTVLGLEGQQLRMSGFCGALYAEWSVRQSFSVITQVEYDQRGMGLGPEVATVDPGPSIYRYGDTYCRVDYLSVPVLAKFQIPLLSINPYLMAGPRVDFFLGHGPHPQDLNVDFVYNHFKKVTWGGSFGVGFHLPFASPVPLAIEARENLDFVNSYQDQFLKVRNNAFDIWLVASI